MRKILIELSEEDFEKTLFYPVSGKVSVNADNLIRTLQNGVIFPENLTDSVEILERILTKIDNLAEPYYCSHYKSGVRDCKKIVQEEITKLKGSYDEEVNQY